MMRKMFKWILPMVLAGSFFATSAIFAQERHDPAPVSNRVDRRQDRRTLRRQGRRLVRRRQRVRASVRQFGAHSQQARIARHRLRRAQRRFNHQARDLRHDRRQALRH